MSAFQIIFLALVSLVGTIVMFTKWEAGTLIKNAKTPKEVEKIISNEKGQVNKNGCYLLILITLFPLYILVIYPAIALNGLKIGNPLFAKLAIALIAIKWIQLAFVIMSKDKTREPNKIEKILFNKIVAALICVYPFYLILVDIVGL